MNEGAKWLGLIILIGGLLLFYGAGAGWLS